MALRNHKLHKLWVAIKKIFSQIFKDYKDEIYADDLQEGWKFIGRKKVRHPSY